MDDQDYTIFLERKLHKQARELENKFAIEKSLMLQDFKSIEKDLNEAVTLNVTLRQESD